MKIKLQYWIDSQKASLFGSHSGFAAQVPGEMFGLAMEARKRDAGVVGSTQNILDFIAAKLDDALQRSFPERVQVCVLGELYC